MNNCYWNGTGLHQNLFIELNEYVEPRMDEFVLAAYYMNPATGSVDTLDGWHPYTAADGLVLVKRDADGSWVEA